MNVKYGCLKKNGTQNLCIKMLKFTERKRAKSPANDCLLFALLWCGAGGIRTRVRTKRHNAFYMLIRRLDCRVQCWFGDQPVCTLAP
jgi:hypothetical protein